MTRQEEEKAALAVSADTEVTPKAKPVQQPEADMGDEAKASTLVDADTQQANKENAIDKLLQSRMQANEAEQQKLEADYQAQQKRQKRNAIISSVADGLSALSNMYFTSKGAPTPTRQAASMSEQQAKQNVADRNTYLELLQGWRKRNNELINNYATYQATAEKNRIAATNASLEVEREARLLAKQDWQKTYQKTYLELKAKKIDDDSAKWKAKIAADEKEAESLDRYRKELAAIGRAKVDKSGQGKSGQGKSGQGTKIIYMRRGKGGKFVPINNKTNE